MHVTFRARRNGRVLLTDRSLAGPTIGNGLENSLLDTIDIHTADAGA